MSKSSSLFYRIYFILVIFLCLENAEGSDTSAFLLKKLHLLYRRRRVGQERSRSSQFTFATLNTHVAKSYSELPPLPSQLSTILSELSGAKPCGASLSVTLTKFRKKGSRTMCLFKIQPDSIQLQSIFHQVSQTRTYNFCIPLLFSESPHFTGFGNHNWRSKAFSVTTLC